MTTDAILFDFRAAPRMAEALYDQLQGVQARFAMHLQSAFTGRLRQPCDVEMVAPVALALPEYLASTVPPAVRYVCPLARFAGQAMVCMLSGPLALHVVARLFGGEGGDVGDPRPLTELEQSVLRDFLSRTLPRFVETARPAFDLDCTVGALAGDAAPPIAGLGDSLVALTWSVRAAAVAGTVTLILPAAIFAPPPVHDEGGTPDRELLEVHVRGVTIPMSARLHFRLPAGQLSRLQEGLVLETGKPSVAEVEVSSNGRPLFAGVLGRHHGHVGVQVTRVIAPELDAAPPTKDTILMTEGSPLPPHDGAAALDELGAASAPAGVGTLDALLDMTLPVSVEFGRATLSIQQVLDLGPGSVIQLERMVGEPIDIYVGDRRLAQGEVVVIGDAFGVRITKVVPAPTTPRNGTR